MSALEPPTDEQIDRAFETGEHVGDPYCGTVYCPVCIEETFAGIPGIDPQAKETNE